MKLFLDTANLKDIEEALREGLVSGITTNPSLLAKEPKSHYTQHMKKIANLCRKYGNNCSLSIEVFTNDKDKMVKQALTFIDEIKYKNLAIKIPISYRNQNNISVIKKLAGKGVLVNCTACHTQMQLVMAAAGGAKYVSLFYNRVRDGLKDTTYTSERKKLLKEKVIEKADFDPNHVLRETRELLKEYPNTEIIAGSMRSSLDIKEAGLNGAHIVTASLNIIKSSLFHFKTDYAVEQFLSDFEKWIK